jgi:hypothetical protein
MIGAPMDMRILFTVRARMMVYGAGTEYCLKMEVSSK